MACLALSARGLTSERRENGLEWLARFQRDDGSVPVTPNVSSPCWPTGLAVLAWTAARAMSVTRFETQTERSVRWLLATRGRRVKYRPDLIGHDTSLRGWPWVDDTHSWVEPTAYAVLALRAAGVSSHPRVREGVRLLADRAFSDGGWNYGNTLVLGNTLRPFPATTGIALTALAGEPREAHIDVSLGYLADELRGIRSPFTLAWGLIGLSAWDARPTDADKWLADSTARALRREPDALEDALLLLADVAAESFVPESYGYVDG